MLGKYLTGSALGPIEKKTKKISPLMERLASRVEEKKKEQERKDAARKRDLEREKGFEDINDGTT